MSLLEAIGEKTLNLVSNKKAAFLILLIIAGGLWKAGAILDDDSMRAAKVEVAVTFDVHTEDAALKEKIKQDTGKTYSNVVNDLSITDESNIAGDNITIYVYPTQEAYLKATGRGKWSIGYSIGDTVHLIQGSSLSYVLPHEIAHVLLRRYVRSSNLPGWINEGFATYEEEKISDTYVKEVLSTKISLFKNGDYYSLDELSSKGISTENLEQVRFWYAESYSIVKFLIEEHGKEKFSRFCVTLSEGAPLNSAIQKVYSGIFYDSSDLTRKWAEHMKR